MEIAYYAVLPASVRYDTKLSHIAKLLYAEITATVNHKRWCFEKLEFWARLFDVKESTVVKHLRMLDRENYVVRQIRNDSDNRIILPAKQVDRVVQVEVKRPEPDRIGPIADEVVKTWNDMFADIMTSKVKRTEAFDEMLTERLDSYSKKEILSALKNRHDYVRSSEWHNKPENRHLMSRIHLVLESDEALLNALNTKVVEDKSKELREVKFE